MPRTIMRRVYSAALHGGGASTSATAAAARRRRRARPDQRRVVGRRPAARGSRSASRSSGGKRARRHRHDLRHRRVVGHAACGTPRSTRPARRRRRGSTGTAGSAGRPAPAGPAPASAPSLPSGCAAVPWAIAQQAGEGLLERGRRHQPRLVGAQVVEGEPGLADRQVPDGDERVSRPGQHAARRAARRHVPAERAQRVDADRRAVLVRVVVDELVAVELVEDAVQRRLHEHRGALVLQHRDEHRRRAVPALARVEVGQVVVQRHRRRDDALLALDVERVEVVDQPVADAAVGLHAAGDDREVAAVRLVVVALRAVDHQADHRAARPSRRRRRGRCHSVIAANGLCAPPRGASRISARSASAGVARGQRRAAAALRAEAEVLRPDRARDEAVGRRACRAASARASRRTCSDEASA